jgi:hypothetical protein
VTSAAPVSSAWGRVFAALEVLGMYAGILEFIWRWQYSHALAWIPMLAVIVASHFLHRDRLADLGLNWRKARASASIVLPLAIVLYVPILIYGFVRGALTLAAPDMRVAEGFAGYLIWCSFQQYLMQSFFHHRLRSIIASPHLSSLLVAVMFGVAHIPNPVLMVATTVGGFLLAEIFLRHRCIWPLALAQAVGGFLLGAVSPASLIRHMRVGPSYFFYGLR